jgi:hypothetical protein
MMGCSVNLGRWLRSGAVLGVVASTATAPAAPTAEREVIGRSPDGTPIEVWTVADRDAADRSPDERPALVVIAGVQGHHQIGVRVAEALGQLLIDQHADALAGRTAYIVPRVNPDGVARFASAGAPRVLSGRAPEQQDADRDRRTDEDPPNDLNGDGFITMMRAPAPNARYGLEPTHVVDDDDARIVREPGDDERATHVLLIEGVDDDGDGRFNEDGWGGASGGGVDLDMHFPTHWPEHTDGAGRFPLDRPEARAVVEWMQSRGNIAAVIVLGPHDTVVSIPPTGQYGPDGRVPKGIESGDADAYELASETFADITGITATEPGPDRAGSLVQWCYADLGVYAFGTPVWVRPDLVNRDEAASDDDAETLERSKSADPESNETNAGPTPAEIEAADRADLAERGVGQMFIDFLYMDADERTGIMTDMQSMSESDLANLMEQFTALPGDVQARLRAVQMGGEDPGPSEELLDSIGATLGAGATARAGAGNSSDAKWLAWIDEHSGGGFVDWQPFDHPQLGSVEIGGFVPGVRVNPPAEEEDRLARQQAAFAAAVLDMLPTLELDKPTVERVGGGVWRIGLTLRNTGTLPTMSAIGEKTRRLPGVVCVLDPNQELEMGRVVSGSRAIHFASIEGRGSSERAEWLVIADAGETIELEVRSARFGTTRYDVTMEAR